MDNIIITRSKKRKLEETENKTIHNATVHAMTDIIGSVITILKTHFKKLKTDKDYESEFLPPPPPLKLKNIKNIKLDEIDKSEDDYDDDKEDDDGDDDSEDDDSEDEDNEDEADEDDGYDIDGYDDDDDDETEDGECDDDDDDDDCDGKKRKKKVYSIYDKLSKETVEFLKSDKEFEDKIFYYYTSLERKYFDELSMESKLKVKENEMIIKNNDIIDKPYRFMILNLEVPLHVKDMLIKKINNLYSLSPFSGEYGKIKSYLNNMLCIPFGTYIDLPIKNTHTVDEKVKYLTDSKSILNGAIYGHKEPKDYILRILAQWINKPDAYGNCIALEGPMGNGKTTLVRNGICKAMNRPFGFIPLGGCSDSSYLVGHDFTYEGSIYGKIAQIIIECKCMNPIIYFDELDKVSNDSRGKEIINTLIHITDSSQNSTYQDKYFNGVDLDLSRVLFVFSFNDRNLIDPILKDRITIIKTNGYSIPDKINISHDFLITEQIDKMGLNPDDIVFPNEILEYIINKYTKEDGVRTLKRCLEKIISKLNLLFLLENNVDNKELDVGYSLQSITRPLTITNKIVEEFLDKENLIDDNVSKFMMYI